MEEVKGNVLKIGISMRITDAIGYSEKRDTIARDWQLFLLREFPKASWLYLPNIGKKVVDYIKDWDINAFILSGGENIGTDIERDLSENEIVRYALTQQMPILGVCRGLQVIYEFFGGKVINGGVDFANLHVAAQHSIIYHEQEVMVNSYHQNALVESSCPPELSVVAHCKEDNSVEAVEASRILGIMWHPERIPKFGNWDVDLIKKLFNYK